MICPIDPKNQLVLRAKIERDLKSIPSLDPPSYIRSIYNLFTSPSRTSEMTLHYTRLVPGMIRGILRQNPALENKFDDSTLNQIRSLERTFSGNDGLKQVSNYLVAKAGLISDIDKQINLAQRAAKQQSDRTVITNHIPFNAAPHHVNSTKGWGELNQPMQDFQKDLVQKVISVGDSSRLEHPLYLTAMSADKLGGNKGEVMFAVTDKEGNPHYFDNQGKIISESSNQKPIDISKSSRKSPYFQKDVNKFSKANKLISRGSPNSSSEAYRIAVGSQANLGQYDSSDIVGISAEGNRIGRVKPDFIEIKKAIDAGVTFITDKSADRSRDYNIGEREISQFLSRNGYKEVQDGTWKPVVQKEIPKQGSLMYYPSRGVKETFKGSGVYVSGTDLTPVDRLVEELKKRGIEKSRSDVEALRQGELKIEFDIAQHILKNPDAKITTLITDKSSAGYLPFDYNSYNIKTPLNSVELDSKIQVQEVQGAPYIEGFDKGGATYFTIKGVQKPVQVQKNDLSKDLVDKLISTIVDPIKTESGNLLPASKRKELVLQYLLPNKDFSLDNSDGVLTLTLDGQIIPQDQVKDRLSDYFSKYRAIPNWIPKNLTDKQKQDALDPKDPDFQRKLSPGKIVKNDNTYEKWAVPTFNVNNILLKGNSPFDHYTLEKKGEDIIYKPNLQDYYNWLKENTYVNYKADKGKFITKNPYFVYKLTDEAKDVLYPQTKESSAKQPVIAPKHVKISPQINLDAFADEVIKRGLKKSSKMKESEYKTAQEKLISGKAWYENSPLIKHFPYVQAFNVVNSDHVAKWTRDGITLNFGSDYSDLFHEGWHGFTQGFLTQEDKQGLYSELKKKTGSFTDYKGNTVKFSKANPLQLEEHLAEDFRKYMLSIGKHVLDSRPVRNTIFRRIYLFLKSLFGKSSYQELLTNDQVINTVRDLYENLRIGNLHDYTFSEKNFYWDALHKAGIEAIDPKDEVKKLSTDYSTLAVDTLDGIISTAVDGTNDKIYDLIRERDFLKNKEKLTKEEKYRLDDLESYDLTYKTAHLFSTQEGRTQVYKQALAALKQRRDQIDAQLLGDDFSEFDVTEVSPEKAVIYSKKLQDKVDTLDWMIKNFGDPQDPFARKAKGKGVIAYHNIQSKFLSYADKFDTDKDITIPDRIFLTEGNEVGVVQGGRPEILYTIRGLHQIDKTQFTKENLDRIDELESKPDKTQIEKNILSNLKENLYDHNILGFRKIGSFPSMIHRISRVLAGSDSKQQMLERLVENQYRYPYLKQLIEKLGDPNDQEVYSQKMWGAMFQTFNKYPIDLITSVFNKETDTKDPERPIVKYNVAIGKTYGADKQIQNSWERQFRASNISLDLGDILNKYKRITKENIFDFYSDLGVALTDIPEVRSELTKEGKGSFLTRADFLLKRIKLLNDKHIIVDGPKSLFRREYPGLGKADRTHFNKLAQLEAKNSDMYAGLSIRTATDDTRQEVSLNNSMTAIVKAVNNSDTYQDLIDKLPQFDTSRSPFPASSKTLDSLFDKDGNKRPGALYLIKNIDGTKLTENNESTGIGVSSAWADEFTKMIQDLHDFFFLGDIENPRGADSKSSYVTRSEKYISPYNREGFRFMWMSPDHFSSSNTILSDEIYDSMIPYLEAEHKRVQIMRNLQPGDPELNYPNYVKNGKDFSYFGKILSEKTKNELYDFKQSLDFMSPDLKKSIQDNFIKFFDNYFDQVEQKFDKAPFIAPDVFKIMKDTFKINDERVLTSMLIKSFAFNNWIHNIESTIMIYGDVAQYKEAIDFHKRDKLFGSTGDIPSTDPSTLQFINGQLKDSNYAETKGFQRRIYNGSLNTAIMEDPRWTSEYIGTMHKQISEDYRKRLKNSLLSKEEQESLIKNLADTEVDKYKNMKIGDAQGWITFDAYRALSLAYNKWSDYQEELYRAIVRGAQINPNAVTEHFPVRKLQYAGPLLTNSGLPVNAEHKFSLFPLIPSVIKGQPLEQLHNRMMRDGMDYATLDSGSKLTTVTNQGVLDKMFLDKELTKLSDDKFTPNVVNMDFLKDQQNVGETFKGKATFSTQMRKIASDAMMQYGVPEDFQTDKSTEERIKNWEKLPEKDKLKSEKYQLVKKYENAIDSLTTKLTDKLIKQLGWDYPAQFGKVNKTLIKMLEGEFFRQDMSPHELSAVRQILENTNGPKDLSLLLNAEQAEKSIMGLINRKLIRQKVNGEPLVQVSDIAWGTRLPFYEYSPDGTKPAGCMIALQGDFLKLLNEFHNDGETIDSIDRLNEMIRNPKWLAQDDHQRMITMVGPRIPVEELNSIEFLQVHQFLPKEAGNIIVLPFEIVAKSGSDFDVDKLTMLMPNIADRNDKIFLWKNFTEKESRALYEDYKKFKADESEGIYDSQMEQQLADAGLIDEENPSDIKTFEQFNRSLKANSKGEENDLLWSVRNLLQHPDNYPHLVRPNETYITKPIADKLRPYVTEYNPTKDGKITGTDLMSYVYNGYVHVINKTSGESLAIAAVDNTFDKLLNRIGARMNYSYLDHTRSATDPKTFTEKLIRILLPHNTLKDNKGRDVISLSHFYEANGINRISTNIAQIINQLLDVIKDDSPYFLHLIKEVTPTMLFLNKAGVPFETLAYFANQPVIRNYFKEMTLARSPLAGALGKAPEGNRNFFVNKARSNMLTDSKYNFDYPSFDGKIPRSSDKPLELWKGNPRTNTAIKDIYNITRYLESKDDGKTFNPQDMFNRIKEYSKTKDFKMTDKDRLTLLHWFEIEDIAKAYKEIKFNINPDTKKSVTALNVMTRQDKIDQMDPLHILPDWVTDKLLTETPIASFGTIGKFSLDLLRPLFPIRANQAIGDFVNAKWKRDIDPLSGEGSTPFKDIESFSSAFYNDLVSYVFQNKLKQFNVTNHYKNLSTSQSIPVQQTPQLKFGAFVKNNTLYYDKKQLIKDFTSGDYLSAEYNKKGLAALKNKLSISEFFNYTFEREYLRSQIKPSDVTKDPHYENLLAKNKGKVGKEKVSFEQYLRDRALDNISNPWKIFRSDDTYADQVKDTIKRYNLSDDNLYPLLQNFDISEGPQRMRNLLLKDYDLDGNKIESYHNMFKALADPSVIKHEDDKINNQISELFQRFPVYAVLQSGLNTKGAFSFIRLIPDDHIREFMEGAMKTFTSKLDTKQLESFYRRFITNNSSDVKNRFKDYYDPEYKLHGQQKQPISLTRIMNHWEFDAKDLTPELAKNVMAVNPNMIFVYDKALKGTVPNQRSSTFESTDQGNRLGLPTLNTYSDFPDNSEANALSDKTLDSNKKMIDEAIETLKTMRDSGNTLAFSKDGYGQRMIGYRPDGVTPLLMLNKKKPGLNTLNYLSSRLFQEFGYVNKNYSVEQPAETTEETPVRRLPVTDKEVQEHILNCLEL